MEGDKAQDRFQERLDRYLGALGTMPGPRRCYIAAGFSVLREAFLKDFGGIAGFVRLTASKETYLADIRRLAGDLDRAGDADRTLAYRLFGLWVEAVNEGNSALAARLDRRMAPFVERARLQGHAATLSPGYEGRYACPLILWNEVPSARACTEGLAPLPLDHPAAKFLGGEACSVLAGAYEELRLFIDAGGRQARLRLGEEFEHLLWGFRQGGAGHRLNMARQLVLVGDLFLGDFESLKGFGDAALAMREIYLSALRHTEMLMIRSRHAAAAEAFRLFRLMLTTVHLSETSLILRYATEVDRLIGLVRKPDAVDSGFRGRGGAA